MSSHDDLKKPLLISDDYNDENTPLISATVAMDKTASEMELAQKAEQARRSKMLLFSFIVMVFVGLGNKIFNKLQTLPMHNYPYFLSLLTTFIYVPASFAYIIPMIIWGKQITPEQRAIPWYKFAIMGALDGIAGVMQTFATNFINSGALLILLQQSAIPISMIITKYMLKVKYAVWNYVGALIVVIGLIIVLLPSMLNSDDSEPKLFFVWVAVMLVSCIPMTLSSVYKEKALGETEIDVVYLNGWVAVYQLIVTLIFAVPCGYANEPPIPPKDLPKNLYDGLLCYVGITVNNTLDAGNSTMTTNSTMMSTMSMMNMSTSAMSSTASTMMMNMSSVMPTMMMMMNDSSGNHTQVLGHCDGSGSLSSPLAVNVYMAFNILYNVFIILILKYGGSNVLWLAMTLMVPLGNAAFALPFVPGNKPMTPFDGVGLVVIMIGLIFYRFWAPLTKFLPHNSRVWLARFSLGPPLPRDDEDESTIDQTGSVKYPLLGSVMSVEAVDPIYVVRPERKLIRTQHQIRSAYFARLGIGAPDRQAFAVNGHPQ